MHTTDQTIRRYPTTLAIRLPKDLKKALFDRATAADRTPSALVRRLIREHLDAPLTGGVSVTHAIVEQDV